MFVLALIAAIPLGYLFRGRLGNLADINLKGVYLIVLGFLIEFAINMLIGNKTITIGLLTYFSDVVMYILIFTFIYRNRENPYILAMGAGFLLNAIPIFLNGGMMPVSESAVKVVGFSTDVSSEGLYTLINSSTNLSFLGDIIPINFIGRFIVSIGDIIAAIAMMLFIITSMRKESVNA